MFFIDIIWYDIRISLNQQQQSVKYDQSTLDPEITNKSK